VGRAGRSRGVRPVKGRHCGRDARRRSGFDFGSCPGLQHRLRGESPTLPIRSDGQSIGLGLAAAGPGRACPPRPSLRRLDGSSRFPSPHRCRPWSGGEGTSAAASAGSDGHVRKLNASIELFDGKTRDAVDELLISWRSDVKPEIRTGPHPLPLPRAHEGPSPASDASSSHPPDCAGSDA
jgi:hypothetical protein